MNLNPELSTGTAIFMVLFAASMWGSWFVSLKYLGDYPIDGFLVTLFTTSILFVWTVGFLLDGGALLGNLYQTLRNDPVRIFGTIVGGMVYVTGIRFSLLVFRTIGLSIAQPISSSISIVVGTVSAALVGGVPEGVSLSRIGLAVVILIGAVFASMLAGHLRSINLPADANGRGMRTSTQELWRALGLILVSSAFSPAYPLALSFGLRSATHPEGLAVLPFMAMLSTGAFLGTMLTSGVALTRRGQWGMVLRTPFRLRKWGMGSGLFHYGGNIIHTFATAHLSSAVSWPLAVSSGFWTQLWGLAYGEFEGAPRRAYVALAVALTLYLTGAYLIASNLYQ